ncbi:MAG: hypothetical protein U5Q16_16295 [Gammaproteobacteria bacterium]|nr:hypothetical protein [Gammaproteobacteria bacterium]
MKTIDLRNAFPIRTSALPGGRWLLGLGIFAVLLSAFWLSGLASEEEAVVRSASTSYGTALFFSAIIGYIVPVFGFISERTQAAIDLLEADLAAEPEEVQRWREGIYRKPLAWLVSVLLIGLVSGTAHNALLYGSVGELLTSGLASPPEAATTLGTLLTWVVMTTVIAALLDNAHTLRRSARVCRVDLLNTHRLRPFATVAVISTLALIGAQAAFPLMAVENELEAVTYVPGLLATGIPMLILAALPVWPIHRRMAQARHLALADINNQIARLPAVDTRRPDTVAALAPLLAYRRELREVSVWPFDAGVLTRLALYLIIPPLTWVGAALIENVVNAFL